MFTTYIIIGMGVAAAMAFLVGIGALIRFLQRMRHRRHIQPHARCTWDSEKQITAKDLFASLETGSLAGSVRQQQPESSQSSHPEPVPKPGFTVGIKASDPQSPTESTSPLPLLRGGVHPSFSVLPLLQSQTQFGSPSQGADSGASEAASPVTMRSPSPLLGHLDPTNMNDDSMGHSSEADPRI